MVCGAVCEEKGGVNMADGACELKTRGYVLRRTNYGEADRILGIITPEGKVSVIAKGVRRPKSRLAGGVEIFTLSDIVVRFGKSELGTLTGARMVEYYGGILKDYGKMALASEILKKVERASESSDSAEYFELARESLTAIDRGVRLDVVDVWFRLNLMRVMGEEPNMYRDIAGEKLKEDRMYDWNVAEGAFEERGSGGYGADEIKIVRLMLTAKLDVVLRVKDVMQKIGKISNLIGVMVK